MKFTIEKCIKLYDAEHPTLVPLDSSINVEEIADKYLEEAEHPKKDKSRKKYSLRPRINK